LPSFLSAVSTITKKSTKYSEIAFLFASLTKLELVFGLPRLHGTARHGTARHGNTTIHSILQYRTRQRTQSNDNKTITRCVPSAMAGFPRRLRIQAGPGERSCETTSAYTRWGSTLNTCNSLPKSLLSPAIDTGSATGRETLCPFPIKTV